MTSRREGLHNTITSVRSSTISRRQFMRRAAALGLALPSMSALLAACEVNIGVDDDDEPVVDQDDDDVAEEPDDDDLDDDELEPDDDEGVVADEPDDEEPEVPDPEEDPVAIAPELDLDTLEAEAPDGTLTAQRAENSFVGEIAEGRVIGIAFTAEVDMTDDSYDQNEIVVHLYDQQEAALMIGDLDENGAASLESLEPTPYFDATVDLVMEDDVVTGTVTFRDEEPSSFTAEAATGVAGVYWAVGEEDWEFRSADWVVLEDGRHWGAACSHLPSTYWWCIRDRV